jgi:bacteriocin-like protein
MNEMCKNLSLKNLNDNELKSISGGQPTEDTGFWYDAFYVMTASILINPRPTSWATVVRKY